MKKLLLALLVLTSVASYGQLSKPSLYGINARDIKASGAYSSFKLGKLIDSLILSTASQTLSSGHIYVGNVSGFAADVALSGDGTLSSSGALSVTKILGNTIPSNAAGVLSNNGSGTLSWVSGGTVTSVSGTTNRITSTGGATPVIDISASYVGQSSITTLGTIGTGVWQGSSISTSFTDAKIKTVTGTSNRISIGGTSTDPTFDISTSYVGQSSITTLGTIGTGIWQGTKVGLAYGGTNSDLSTTGSPGYVLKQTSTGAAITVAPVLASDVASGADLTKTDDTNVTLSLGGTPTGALLKATSLTLGWTGTLAYSRFVNGAGVSVVGRSANSSGVQADITAGSDDQILRRSSGTVGFGSINLSQSNSVGSSILGYANGGTNNSAGFTAGSVIFAGSSGLTQDNSNLFFDDTNNWIGIGTASPASVLHTVTTSTSTVRGANFDQYNSGTQSSRINLRKARGTGSTVITTGDVLGTVVYAGHDGTSFVDAAQVMVTSTGTISTGVVQGIIALRTANTAGTITTGYTMDGSQVSTFTGQTVSTFTTATGNGLNAVRINPSMTAVATTDVMSALKIDPTFTVNGSNPQSQHNLLFLKADAAWANSPVGGRYYIFCQDGGTNNVFTVSQSGAVSTLCTDTGQPGMTVGSNVSISNMSFQVNQSNGTGGAIFAVYGNTSGRIRLGTTTNGTVTLGKGTVSNTDVVAYNNVGGGILIAATSEFTNKGMYVNVNTTTAPTDATKVEMIGLTGTINLTAYSGYSAAIAIRPTWNQVTSGGAVYALRYDPTSTSVLGTHYGAVIVPAVFNGFGTATPTSSLTVEGSFETSYVAKTAGYTLTATDHTVEVTTGTNTQTLPTAVGISGRQYFVTNSGTGVVTLGTTSSQTFVNVVATPTTLTINQFGGKLVQSNGANWIVMASF